VFTLIEENWCTCIINKRKGINLLEAQLVEDLYRVFTLLYKYPCNLLYLISLLFSILVEGRFSFSFYFFSAILMLDDFGFSQLDLFEKIILAFIFFFSLEIGYLISSIAILIFIFSDRLFD